MNTTVRALPPPWKAYGDLFKLAQDSYGGKRAQLVDKLNKDARERGMARCSYSSRAIDSWKQPPKPGAPSRAPRDCRREHLHIFFKEMLVNGGQLEVYSEKLKAITIGIAECDVAERPQKGAGKNRTADKGFVTVDFSRLSATLPSMKINYGDFSCVLDFLNFIWFDISNIVSMYTYGHSWVLCEAVTHKVIKTQRMIEGLGPGFYHPDPRPLREAGIMPGMTLEAIRLK
jgi:hypothetical protein